MSTTEEITKKMLVLRTSDHKEFTVEKSMAEQSITIKNMMEDLDEDGNGSSIGCIPLPNVNSEALTKIIEHLKLHDASTSNLPEENIFEQEKYDKAFFEGVPIEKKNIFEQEKYDKAFFEGVPIEKIFELITAANYLNIRGLLDILCQKVADHIKNKSPAYVRKLFNIENDFTEEEEKAIISVS